jgi:hypothetical protein
MTEERATTSDIGDLRAVFHRLNNQLGVILAYAELLHAKAPDDTNRARADQMIGAALEAMSLTRALRDRTSLDEQPDHEIAGRLQIP